MTDANRPGGPHDPTGDRNLDELLDEYRREPLPKGPGEADPDRVNVMTQRVRSAAHQDLSPRRQSLRDLADATRALIDNLIATDAPDDLVAETTASIWATAERFEPYRDRRDHYGLGEAANAGDRMAAMFDGSPLIGVANPLAPPMRLDIVDDAVIGEVRFGQAYEGPPGCVHGGYIAAAFDELLGSAQSLSGAPGMTGTLSIRYESPTPLNADLRMEARLVGVERRKIFTEGTISAGDRVTARATGIFISLQPGTFLDLLEERRAREAEHR